MRSRVGHKTHRDTIYLPDGRPVKATAFPISIDTAGFEELARSEGVAERAAEIREALGNPRKIFLGVDRLDYTKGIHSRLRAFGELVRDGKLDVEDAVFVQVATPSRERVEQYRILRDEIELLVGRINGDHGRIGRPAISYLHSSLPARGDGGALPRRRRHGRHAVPRRDEPRRQGVRRLPLRQRRRAGALASSPARPRSCARRWLVNPYDIDGMKAALLEAFAADDKETATPDAGHAQDRGRPRRREVGRTTSSSAARGRCPTTTTRRCAARRRADAAQAGDSCAPRWVASWATMIASISFSRRGPRRGHDGS